MIKNICKKLDFPDEATEFLSKTFDELNAYEDFLAVMDPFFLTDTNEYIDMLAEIAKKHNQNRYVTDMLFLLLATKPLRYIYHQQGLPEEIFWDSVKDLKYKLIECKNMHNIWGTFVLAWFRGFYKLNLFSLGRLEFEKFIIGYDYKDLVKKGDFVLNCHIPSSGPLTPELVDDSLKRAYEFFGYNGKPMVVYCHSWMLFPEIYKNVFPKGSNLSKFYERFDVLEDKATDDFENRNLWRIFYKEKLEDITPDDLNTSLTKNLYTFLKNGGNMGIGEGFIVYKP